MKPRHFWYLMEVKSQEQKPKQNLSRQEAKALRKMMDQKSAALSKRKDHSGPVSG